MDANRSCRNCSYGSLCYTAVSIEQILDNSSNFIAIDKSDNLLASVDDIMITVANACSNCDCDTALKNDLTIQSEQVNDTSDTEDFDIEKIPHFMTSIENDDERQDQKSDGVL